MKRGKNESAVCGLIRSIILTIEEHASGNAKDLQFNSLASKGFAVHHLQAGAGYSHSALVTNRGELITFGSDEFGQVAEMSAACHVCEAQVLLTLD